MNPLPVKARLHPLVRRRWATRLWTRLALCWLTGSLAGLVFLGLGARWGGLPPLVVPGLVTLSGLAAVWLWSRHRLMDLDWRGCARDIESRRPELNGRLLTAIEQQPDEQGRFSYLQSRLFDEVLAHDRMFNWSGLLPASRLGFSRLFHALTLAAFLATCLKLGSLQTAGPRETHLPKGVVVTPGDTTVERGSSLVVMVRFNDRVPPGVDLTVRPAGASAQRIALVRSLEDPVFGGTIPEITQDLEYVAEYAGHRSRAFQVRVFDYPELERADVDLDYPEYTGLPPKRIENTRHVTAVEGTRMNLTLQLNKPVERAQLLPKSTGVAPVLLTADPKLPQAQVTGLVLSHSQRYALQLVDADGRTNRQAVQFVFNALSNRVPEMHLAAPRGDIRPSALEEITFQGTVFDDFGVSAYGLAYVVGGQRIRTVELGRQVPGKEKRAFEHVLALEDLGVQPGDLVSWFLWTEDTGPDGEMRQTMSDLYFAEIRPFEEIFRQGQSQFGQLDPRQQAGGGGGGMGRLLELQQQIIHATWKLQRQHAGSAPWSAAPGETFVPAISTGTHTADHSSEGRRLNGSLGEMLASSQLLDTRMQFRAQRADTGRDVPSDSPRPSSSRPGPRVTVGTADSRQDLQVVMDAQRSAISRAREARLGQQDPGQIALWDEAIEHMESALEQLGKATNSPAAFREALAAQQAAYQQLLRLQEREYSVSRNRNNAGSQSARGRQMQRQLDQLDLTPEENRYETERLAQAPQSAEQREQMQVMSRLAELARRQQDINERLQELQVALQAASTEEEREQLRRELKRLEDEQQQMLSDLDELRQRLDSQDNQSRFADQREQLEQTRQSVRRAAEAAGQGAVSEALAAGTRAQREMQQMREDLRNQSASAFADDLRQMRSAARELARQQAEVQEQIEELSAGGARRSLRDAEETNAARDRLGQQRKRLTNLVDQASQVSQLAEEAEPAMSSELYDTLREFNQDDLGAVKEVQEDLLANGLFPLYERLKTIAEGSEAKALDMTSTVLEEGYPQLARQTGQRALQDINDLARGIERAAELVVGDDTEALRRAQQQLQELTDQLEQEAARATRDGTNAQAEGSATTVGREASRTQTSESDSSESGSAENDARGGIGESANGSGQPRGAALAQGGEPQSQSNQSDRSQGGNPGGGAPGRQGEEARSAAANGASGPAPFDLDQFLGGEGGRGGPRGGPLTGDGFGPWSDGLREVEEMVELPDLRDQVTRARERARQLRRDYTRHRQKPDWAQVRLKVVQPLVEVQKEIGEELARRQSRENLVPIDRDPVPDRFSELVRRYYEELGGDSH